jgi:hypothetical protein
MNLKTFVSATFALIGTYILGFPLVICFLAFNAFFWCEIVYDLITYEKEEVVEETSEEIASESEKSMQIEFERFLIRKYVELEALENEILTEEIPIMEHRPVALAEA